MNPQRGALLVVTSVERFPQEARATGVWFGEAARFYDVMRSRGFVVDLVSPRGGLTPIDPTSLTMGMKDLEWKYYADPDFRQRLANTLRPEQVDPSRYGVIYFAGGHGAIWDFPDNLQLQNIAMHIFNRGGIVASVCHGVAGLFNLRLPDGRPLLTARTATGFSNDEEAAIGLTGHVPYLVEDEMKKRGANYVKQAPNVEFAVADTRVVTGQNANSPALVAELVLKEMAKFPPVQ